MPDVRDQRGGVVGQVICSILAVLGAIATVFVASAAMDRVREGGDPGVFAVVLVPLLFTLAFLLIAVMSGVQLRQDRVLAERQALNPDEPWLWADQWRDGRIASVSSRQSAIAFAAFAAFWNLFVVAVIYAVWHGNSPTETAHWVFLGVFALVGIGLGAGAAYLAVQARKSPPTIFEMATLPGVLGGDLRGTISLPPHIPAGSAAQVRVSCVRTPRSSSRTRSDTTLWQDEVRVQTPADGVLPVSLRLPFDVPPSQAPSRSDEPATVDIRWYLFLNVSMPGVDYSQAFVVPVFATSSSDRAVRAGQLDTAADVERPTEAKATVVESDNERTVIELPTPQGRGCGLAALLLLPLVTWPVMRYNGADTATALQATGIALFVGAALMVLAGLMMAFTAARIEIDADAVRVLHGRWPFLRTRTIPLASITGVSYGSGEARYVEVAVQGGTTFWIIPGNSAGSAEAKWLAAEVNRAVERCKRVPTAAR